MQPLESSQSIRRYIKLHGYMLCFCHRYEHSPSIQKRLGKFSCGRQYEYMHPIVCGLECVFGNTRKANRQTRIATSQQIASIISTQQKLFGKEDEPELKPKCAPLISTGRLILQTGMFVFELLDMNSGFTPSDQLSFDFFKQKIF